MIRALIIDDEAHCIQRLQTLIMNHAADEVSVAGVYSSAEEGIKGIQQWRPDLVFLDVQMQDKTGFDLLRSLGEINFDIIFTTAYENYAVQAFKFSALDYLLKPVDPDDLLDAIRKSAGKKNREEEAAKLKVLLHNLHDLHGQSRRISVPTSKGFMFLQVSDIVRCQSHINYTTLILKDQQKITIARTLKEFEELLSGYSFFRVHNSHLVNLNYVTGYHRAKGGYVVMADHSEIEVSSRRKDAFLKKLAAL